MQVRKSRFQFEVQHILHGHLTNGCKVLSMETFLPSTLYSWFVKLTTEIQWLLWNESPGSGMNLPGQEWELSGLEWVWTKQNRYKGLLQFWRLWHWEQLGCRTHSSCQPRGSTRVSASCSGGGNDEGCRGGKSRSWTGPCPPCWGGVSRCL